MRVEIKNGVITISEDDLMATLADVQSAVADLQATGQAVEDGIDQVLVKLQALKDQMAAGGAATAADLDAVMAQLATAKAPLTDSLAKESTA